MKTLSCREAGCECDYIAKGETEEVIRDAIDQYITEHGICGIVNAVMLLSAFFCCI
jgi:predicted small metal-binding protein